MTREEMIQTLNDIKNRYTWNIWTDEVLDCTIKEIGKKGYWIGKELGECSVCGYQGCASDIWNGYEKDTYCPSCGARLEWK